MLSNSFTRKVNTQAKWMFLLVILPLYMYCGSIIISAFLKFIIITFSLTLSESTINCYVNLLFDLGMLIIVWLTFKDSMIEQWHDFKQDIKGHLLYGLLIGTALVYGVGIVGGFITLLLGGASTSENQNLIQTIVAAHPFLMSLTTVVFAPLLEETIFRGIVFGWVYEINPKLAHLVSAFVFGFVHVMISVLSGNISEWIQIFSYFFMGAALSYLYEKRNNIYVPILSHAMNNFIAMLLMIF